MRYNTYWFQKEGSYYTGFNSKYRNLYIKKYRGGPITWPLWTKCVEARRNIHRFEMSHFKMLLKVLSKEKRCGMKVVSINYRRSVGGWWKNPGNLYDTWCELHCTVLYVSLSTIFKQLYKFFRLILKKYKTEPNPSFLCQSVKDSVHHRCSSKVYYVEILTQPHLGDVFEYNYVIQIAETSFAEGFF